MGFGPTSSQALAPKAVACLSRRGTGGGGATRGGLAGPAAVPLGARARWRAAEGCAGRRALELGALAFAARAEFGRIQGRRRQEGGSGAAPGGGCTSSLVPRARGREPCGRACATKILCQRRGAWWGMHILPRARARGREPCGQACASTILCPRRGERCRMHIRPGGDCWRGDASPAAERVLRRGPVPRSGACLSKGGARERRRSAPARRAPSRRRRRAGGGRPGPAWPARERTACPQPLWLKLEKEHLPPPAPRLRLRGTRGPEGCRGGPRALGLPGVAVGPRGLAQGPREASGSEGLARGGCSGKIG